MDLSLARVVVTGGASGLGAATAEAFAGAGADVMIFDRDADAGQARADALGTGFACVDVTSPGSVGEAMAQARARMGGVSVLVNCAGIAAAARTLGRDGPHDPALFQRTVDINLVGSFNCLRLAADEMARNVANEDGERGVIINTASVAAFDGQKGQVAYAASKGGIVALSLPAARDLATRGIRVNAIAPGTFLTPMLEGLGPEVVEALASDVTFPKRLGRPSEFARLACFIVECAYLNGAVIRLDGALRMR